jgi:hypothetical protein
MNTRSQSLTEDHAFPVQRLSGPGPAAKRLAYEQRLSPDWGMVFTEAQRIGDFGTDLAVLNRLASRIQRDEPVEQDVREAVSRLLIGSGDLGTASRLLKPVPTRSMITEFARAADLAFRQVPLLVDHEVHRVWNDRIRSGWSSFIRGETERLSTHDALFLHESLLGRTLSELRSLQADDARRLVEAYYELVDNSRLGRAIDPGRAASRLGGPVADLDEVMACAAQINARSGALGPVTLASVVHVEREHWSLLVVGSNGRTEAVDLRHPGILRFAKRASEQDLTWRRFVWPPALRHFGKDVIVRVQEINPGTRWLALALEPRLARVPWQDLVRRITTGASGSVPCLVTLIPSLTWLRAAEYGEPHPSCDARVIAASPEQLLDGVHEEDKPDFLRLRERVLEMDKRTDLSGWCFVLGHGTWFQRTVSAIPAIVVEAGRLTIEDWMRIAERRVCVLHSCYGGRTRRVFMGDFGGLLHLLLAGRVRFFCGPVSKVHPRIATEVQEELTVATGAGTLGERYLAALQKNPAVGVYTAYGLACEPVHEGPP